MAMLVEHVLAILKVKRFKQQQRNVLKVFILEIFDTER